MRNTNAVNEPGQEEEKKQKNVATFLSNLIKYGDSSSAVSVEGGMCFLSVGFVRGGVGHARNMNRKVSLLFSGESGC